MSRRRVFIDACVLYPPKVRAIVLGAAADGLFAPLWSSRVLDEWTTAIAEKDPAGLASAEAARAAMAARFPAAQVAAAKSDTALWVELPDPNDAHVLAAAAAAGADTLLTFNLRDFPPRRCQAVGVEPRHPDGFLWEMWSCHTAEIEGVLADVLPAWSGQERRSALKRARLPRLGKAQAGG